MKFKFVIAGLLLLLSGAALSQQSDTTDKPVVATQDVKPEKPKAADRDNKPTAKPGRQSIPILSDIPILGSLFQTEDGNAKEMTVLMSDFTGPERDKRVSLDISDMPLKAALQMLFDQVQLKFEAEKDLPDNARVTLKLNNVRFATALNALTESAGIGWQQQVTVKDKKVTTTYRVGKSLKSLPPLYQLPADKQGNMYHFQNGTKFFDSNTLPNPKLNRPFLNVKPGEKFVIPKIELPAKPMTLDHAPAGVYNLLTQEERHTFTCPHCKQQVTILDKHQSPKCEKCGRTFQTDWQFCPFDGVKRPASPDSWQFCPHCGKRVS